MLEVEVAERDVLEYQWHSARIVDGVPVPLSGPGRGAECRNGPPYAVALPWGRSDVGLQPERNTRPESRDQREEGVSYGSGHRDSRPDRLSLSEDRRAGRGGDPTDKAVLGRLWGQRLGCQRLASGSQPSGSHP